MPILLEWGCGRANAVRDLTNDPEIKGRASIYGYSDVWYEAWNNIEGVKFLFFVKEHLAEYFKRKHLKIDFVFTHAGLENLKGQDLVDHLKSLATVMVSGGIIVFPSISCRSELEFLEITNLFEIKPIFYQYGSGIGRTYILTKKASE
jgi:hypothetical protein